MYISNTYETQNSPEKNARKEFENDRDVRGRGGGRLRRKSKDCPAGFEIPTENTSGGWNPEQDGKVRCQTENREEKNKPRAAKRD